MIILICLIVIFFCLYDGAVEADNEARRYNDNLREERRHRELIEATKKRNNGNKKYTQRRIVKKGDVTLGEEIIEEEV